jgi:hypothetical protein
LQNLSPPSQWALSARPALRLQRQASTWSTPKCHAHKSKIEPLALFDLGSILQNSISAEMFLDKFSSQEQQVKIYQSIREQKYSISRYFIAIYDHYKKLNSYQKLGFTRKRFQLGPLNHSWNRLLVPRGQQWIRQNTLVQRYRACVFAPTQKWNGTRFMPMQKSMQFYIHILYFIFNESNKQAFNKMLFKMTF